MRIFSFFRPRAIRLVILYRAKENEPSTLTLCPLQINMRSKVNLIADDHR